MSKITSKVAATVKKALDEYGDPITIIARDGTEYHLYAIARRPVFVMTGDATLSEYYFLVAVGDFLRIQEAIGLDAAPAPFFGDERIVFNNEVYVLRSSEPYEYYDGTRQVIRLWGVKSK